MSNADHLPKNMARQEEVASAKSELESFGPCIARLMTGRAVKDLIMSENFQQLVEKAHAFYEVSPYYVVLEEARAGVPTTSGRVQAGFNVDIYGVRPEDNEPVVPPPQEYVLGYAELQKIAEMISRHTSESCSLEVVPFPSVAIIRDHGQVEAMVRIRISCCRGLNRPTGLPEQHALEEVEQQLQGLGIAPKHVAKGESETAARGI